MAPKKSPSSLYTICLNHLLPIIEKFSKNWDWDSSKKCEALEKLPGAVVTDLLLQAYLQANTEKSNVWREEWKIYYTSKIVAAILNWNEDLIEYIGDKCQSLQQLEVVQARNINLSYVPKLPKSVITLDFDGELVHRGQTTTPLLFSDETKKSWLPASEDILKALQLLRRKSPEVIPSPKTRSLTEIHLGTIQASAGDLKIILQTCPNLKLLRHYQLVKALFELHCEAWRNKQHVPVYKLKNLDVDFSHVVRCRMSPEWVLAPEALQLAVLLCPDTTSVRLRFDCSTPNYVLAPLLVLERLKEFSAVCVSSGERTLLDFTDLAPILEKFGPTVLHFLELKVIEEVEIHTIIENCTKLETLVLSGCGYVTPTTCSSYNCNNYLRGSLKKLRLLFFADGDDFSWDHGVPECFWKATLFPSGRNRIVHLEGLFLEFPRIPTSLSKNIYHEQRLPFPELRVVSFCRYTELTVDDVAAILGLKSKDDIGRCKTLKYLRLSDCEQVGKPEGKRLAGWMKQCGMGGVKIDVDT